MRLLVTGGLGFIGSNFIRRRLAEQPLDRIVNLDKLTYAGNRENLADLEGDRRYKWILGDIADVATVERAIQGAEAVVHFAAETHVDRSILDAGDFLRTNVLGTRVLLEAALRAGVKRFIHVGTDEVYGSVEKGRSKETAPLAPRSPYAASKAAGDLLALSYHVTFGLPVIVTRASNNFGPRQHPEKALPLLITNALEDKPFPLYGDGKNVRDWLFVEDHCAAIDLLLKRGRPGEVYNIGGERPLANIDLVKRALALLGKPLSLVRRVSDRPGHDRRYALDGSKLRRLGWRPRAAFDRELEATIEWYRANEGWWKRLKEGTAFRDYYDRQYAERLKRGKALAGRAS